MSLVELRVELPAYSRSFQVQVQNQWSVREIKEAIKRACPGAPQEHGQRIIWRGRILRDDERVKDIWKVRRLAAVCGGDSGVLTSCDPQSPSDARIVHLAVHPSAWTTSPTTPAQPAAASSSDAQPPAASRPTSRTAPSRTQPQAVLSYPPVPLAFITHKHNTAIQVLTNGQLPQPTSDTPELQRARALAILTVNANGFTWPTIFDQEYPTSSGSGEGVKYEQVVIECVSHELRCLTQWSDLGLFLSNQPFLRLLTPDATPTPAQQHALKVLSQTFPLLSLPSPEPIGYQPALHNVVFGGTPTTNLNQYLQQVGLPPMRLANQANHNPNDPNNPVVAEIRAIPLRALLMPLIMLSFRTFLLMYFFSPSKRPFFGILLSVWILYETWGAMRNILFDRPPAGQGRADNGAGGDQGANAPRGQGAGLAPGAPAGSAPSANRRHLDMLLDHVANMDLAAEDALLDHGGAAPAPSLARKARAFVALLLTTLHPAVWDRRRNVLRRREGRLRTEANVREVEPPAAPADGGAPSEEDAARAQARAQVLARHERRPEWVRRYVDRVQVTEWAEDM